MTKIREKYPLLPLPGEPISPLSDRRSVSTLNFDYVLEKGLILTRTRTPEDPQAMRRGERISIKDEPDPLEWRLFDGKGVPYDKDMNSLLVPGEEIVMLDAKSDILVAVSNLRRVFLYKPTVKTSPLCWENILGSPEGVSSNELILPEWILEWVFSCSVCENEKERTVKFMHENEVVGNFKDANGVRFNFGFTPTIYVLNKSGEKIVYWDTGLPASFSRGFRVPDRTQGLSIAAAGSTVFLIARDANGKLHFYTRMIDYEINGACPGLNISYGHIPVTYPPEGPDGSFLLGRGVRKMPLPGWVEHPIEETMLASILPKIDIRLTGKGDEARELRILGRNIQGEWGYYWKNIADNDWKFCVAPEAEPKNSEEYLREPSEPMYPETQNLSYDCKSVYKKRATSAYMLPKVEKLSEISLELKKFHPCITDSEPFSLVIRHPEEEPQVLCFHAADAWGIHYNKQYDEELVGSIDGEPKALIATLKLTDEQRALALNKKSHIGAYIKKHFYHVNEETKALPIIANNGMAILKVNHERLRFERTVSEQEITCSFYMRKASDPRLTIKPDNFETCAELLIQNKQCLKDIKKIFAERRKADNIGRLVNLGAAALRPLAEWAASRVLKPEDPTYQQAIEDIDKLFRVHRWAEKHGVREKDGALGYQRAKDTLRARINELRELKNELSNTKTMAPA